MAFAYAYEWAGEDKMRVDKPFSVDGYFWLPSDENNKFYGTLKVEEDGKVELEILGKFSNKANLNIIVGQTEEGYFVLEDCFHLTYNIPITSLVKNRIHVTTLYKNISYKEDEKNEDILFNTFSFTVDGLNEWLNIKKIKLNTDITNKKFSLETKELENFTFKIAKDIKLKFQIILSNKNNGDYEITIKQSSIIELISNKKEPLDFFIQLSNKILRFLSLAIDKSINIKNIKVTNSDIYHEYGNEKIPIEIEVYKKIFLFSKNIGDITPHNMLFKYTDIQDSFQEKIQKWIVNYDNLKSALNLFFSVRYGLNQYAESEFLSLAQAFETFHRKLNKSQKKIDYVIRVKEFIKPFQKYINEDVEELSKIIKITRNYYTHYDDKNLNKAVPPEKLYYLSRKMEGILQLNFLKLIGFTEEEIDKIVNGFIGLKNKLAF